MKSHTSLRRLEPGTSDPIRYTCTCTAARPGLTLLFYRYFAKPPRLPAAHHLSPATVDGAAAFHASQLAQCDLGGRIRLGPEGINGTVAGSVAGIARWMNAACRHWSCDGLGLADGDADAATVARARRRFFKPTPGCRCVFAGERSVRVTAEITPMGVEAWAPAAGWARIVELEPWEWHDALRGAGDGRAADADRLLLDVRNFYESRIGYFVDAATGREALRPAIRRFGQWPRFVRECLPGVVGGGGGGVDEEDDGARAGAGGRRRGGRRDIFAYCTGGIRCEKGARYLQEALAGGVGTVHTLRGGVAAYLLWMEAQMAGGARTAQDSLFRGRNYVFDARGSVGLAGSAAAAPVATCRGCGSASDRLAKCRVGGCHLVLVVCEACEGGGGARCCASCGEAGGGDARAARPMCGCERERELMLWGGGRRRRRRVKLQAGSGEGEGWNGGSG